MKRILSVAGCFLIALSLFGCGAKYKHLSNQHIEYAKKAIEIADSYLDYDCSADVASDKLRELENRKDELPNVDNSDEAYTEHLRVEALVSCLYVEMSCADYIGDSEYYQKTLEDRNELAELIGVKKR